MRCVCRPVNRSASCEGSLLWRCISAGSSRLASCADWQEMNTREFDQLLGERKVARHYTEEDLRDDIEYGNRG